MRQPITRRELHPTPTAMTTFIPLTSVLKVPFPSLLSRPMRLRRPNPRPRQPPNRHQQKRPLLGLLPPLPPQSRPPRTHRLHRLNKLKPNRPNQSPPINLLQRQNQSSLHPQRRGQSRVPLRKVKIPAVRLRLAIPIHSAKTRHALNVTRKSRNDAESVNKLYQINFGISSIV